VWHRDHGGAQGCEILLASLSAESLPAALRLGRVALDEPPKIRNGPRAMAFTTPTKEEQVPKRTVAPPAARTQPPTEDPGLRLMLRAVTLLSRTQPDTFTHAARGVAFYLQNGDTPDELVLSAALLRQFPVDLSGGRR
jgi:hypothetical protein